MTTFDKNDIIYSCDLIHGATSPTSVIAGFSPTAAAPAPDLQDFGSATRRAATGERQTNISIAVRVWWSDVLHHPLHLIKQLILLLKDFGLWFMRRVTDITWFPRQQRLSLHSPRRSRLVSRFDERLRPRLQSDMSVPIFTWSSLTKNTILKTFEQMTQIRSDSNFHVHYQFLWKYQNNLVFNSVTVCVFSLRTWPWVYVWWFTVTLQE